MSKQLYVRNSMNGKIQWQDRSMRSAGQLESPESRLSVLQAIKEEFRLWRVMWHFWNSLWSPSVELKYKAMSLSKIDESLHVEQIVDGTKYEIDYFFL